MDLAGDQQELDQQLPDQPDQQELQDQQEPDHQEPGHQGAGQQQQHLQQQGNVRPFPTPASNSDAEQSDKEANSNTSSLSGRVRLEETNPNVSVQELVLPPTSSLPPKLPSVGTESSSSSEQGAIANNQSIASSPASDPMDIPKTSIQVNSPNGSTNMVYSTPSTQPPCSMMGSSGSPIAAIQEVAAKSHDGSSLGGLGRSNNMSGNLSHLGVSLEQIPEGESMPTNPQEQPCLIIKESTATGAATGYQDKASAAAVKKGSTPVNIPESARKEENIPDQSLQFGFSIDGPPSSSVKNLNNAARQQGPELTTPAGGTSSGPPASIDARDRERPRNPGSPLNAPKSEQNTQGNLPHMNTSSSQQDEQNMAASTSQTQHHDTPAGAAVAVEDEATSRPTNGVSASGIGPDQTPAAENPPTSPREPLPLIERESVNNNVITEQGLQQGDVTPTAPETTPLPPTGPPKEQQETEHVTTQPETLTQGGASSPAEISPAHSDGGLSEQEVTKGAAQGESSTEGLTTRERNRSQVSRPEESPVPSHRSAEEDQPRNEDRVSSGGASVQTEPLASPEEGGGASGSLAAAQDSALSSIEQQVVPRELANCQQGLDELVKEGDPLEVVISKDKVLKISRKGTSWEGVANFKIYGRFRRDVTLYISLRPNIQCGHHNNENIAKLYTRVEVTDSFWRALKDRNRNCFVLVTAWVLDRQRNRYSLEDYHEHQITQQQGIAYDQDLVSCDDVRRCAGDSMMLVVKPRVITKLNYVLRDGMYDFSMLMQIP